MGYSIYIGEAKLVAYGDEPEDWDGELVARYAVDAMQHDDAPELPYDFMTGKGNVRLPSYTGWAEFVDKAGLRDLFFNQGHGIMRRHPGCFVLNQEHLDEVRDAKAKWMVLHPNAMAGFDWDAWLNKPDDAVRGRDPILARLVWLEWWINHALTTCKIPAIENG